MLSKQYFLPGTDWASSVGSSDSKVDIHSTQDFATYIG